MAIYECNSCGAQYESPQLRSGPYIHVCDSEVVTHAKFDDSGKMTAPEKREPRANIRNENRPEGFIVRNGKAVIELGDPNDVTRVIRTEVSADIIVSEGLGRKIIAA